MPYKVETNAKNKLTKYVIIRQGKCKYKWKTLLVRVEKQGIKNCEEMKKWRMEREILCPQNFYNTFTKKKRK